jgi:hypothetical protein
MQTLKRYLRSVPVLGDVLVAAKGAFSKRLEFRSSEQYWEDRYALGGNSGAGSYNRLASFKAEIINQFVRDHHVASVIEFGVGDGAQLALAEYPSFMGIDVSKTVVEHCRAKFSSDPTKRFYVLGEHSAANAELALSLDVIYHLVEDAVFERYMHTLFAAATRYVIIYASDKDESWSSKHVRHRNFTRWISEHIVGWTLSEKIANRYPFDPADQDNTSFADFFVYDRA